MAIVRPTTLQACMGQIVTGVHLPQTQVYREVRAYSLGQ
jgi:hypothetical protein